MHKKFIFVLFILVVAALAVIFIQQRYLKTTEEERITASRIVIPQVDRLGEEEDMSELLDPELVSMVPLNSDETLIAKIDMDFDGDGQDDQVNAIKVKGNPFVSLIVGLFNPQKGEYERVATISTPIRQISSFQYSGLDLTGDHRNAIVYQGVVDTGKSILQAFFVERNDTVTVNQIANLEGDETIFIEQTERSDAYMMDLKKDPSFSIWVTSKNSETNESFESKYDWDEEKLQYVLTEQTQEGGNKNQHQAGNTTDNYFSRLDGLWYKIDGSKNNIHYIYVDKDLKQFLFLENDQYELYQWIHSNPRNNGINITAKNDEITNFQRQIDITFNGPDQFKLRLVDILFIVSDGGDWNGEYKKMTDATSYLKTAVNKEQRSKVFIEKLEKNQWTTPDGCVLTFKDGIYTAQSDTHNDTGMYATMDDNKKAFIQFRSTSETPMFKKTYLMTMDKDDNIILQPYVLTPDQSYALDDHIFILAKLD